MVHHFDTNPLDREPGEKLTFQDVTLLAFIGTAALLLLSVFLLGMFCATHRIEAALLTL